jgi:hypothetical protein
VKFPQTCIKPVGDPSLAGDTADEVKGEFR